MTTAQSEAKKQNCWWWQPNQTNISRGKHTETTVCVPVLCTLYTACDMQVICTNYISSVYSTHSFHILTSTVFPSFLCTLLNVTSTKWSPLYPPFLRFFFLTPLPSLVSSTHLLTSCSISFYHISSVLTVPPLLLLSFSILLLLLSCQPFCLYLPLLACLNPPITYSRDLV